MENILLCAILALVCIVVAVLLKNYKQAILAKVTDLVQKAEEAVQGSKMGPEKKALVIAQLEAAGIRVTKWLSKQIDKVVKYLNVKGAWLIDKTASSFSVEGS